MLGQFVCVSNEKYEHKKHKENKNYINTTELLITYVQTLYRVCLDEYSCAQIVK